MNEMNITNARYTTDTNGNNHMIRCDIDGETLFVPLNPGNRHYDEIMRQVNEGTLTIADAE